jgi:hypothetical protein
VTLANHEAMHMAILLNNWNIVDKEEEVITLAEEITNKVVRLLSLHRFTK